MAGYRLFCLDGRNLIVRREDFDAPDDRAAVAHARAHHPDSDCELWELGRKVAYIPARGPTQLIEAI